MKKTIGFYCCTNGFGHFKRVLEVVNLLKHKFDISIFCSVEQFNKFDSLNDVEYIVSHRENIKWEKVISGNSKTVIKNYFYSLENFSRTVNNFDIVVSDNLVGLLEYRNDVIIMGSFLWKDVFESYLGTNDLTNSDSALLAKYNPIIITNKYVETQTVKNYKNKVQFGFGCKELPFSTSNNITHNLVNFSSLKYLPEYYNFIDELKRVYKVKLSNNFDITENTLMIARPGVGTITHCVENHIPLVALYSERDSQEIIELADIVENFKIGLKFNVDEPVDIVKFNYLKEGNISFDTNIEKNGYKNIANFISKYEFI